jgi:hypothetical protein
MKFAKVLALTILMCIGSGCVSPQEAEAGCIRSALRNVFSPIRRVVRVRVLRTESSSVVVERPVLLARPIRVIRGCVNGQCQQ